MLDIFSNVFGRRRVPQKSENGHASTSNEGVDDDFVHINKPEDNASEQNLADADTLPPYPVNVEQTVPLTQPTPPTPPPPLAGIPFSLHPQLKVNHRIRGVDDDISRCTKKLKQIQDLLAKEEYNFSLERSVIKEMPSQDKLE